MSRERSLEELACFPEQNPHPVIELDPSGAVAYVNPAGRAALPSPTDLARSPLLADIDLRPDETDPRPAPGEEVRYRERVYLRHACRVPGTGRVRVFLHDITDSQRALGARDAILGAVAFAASEVLRADDPDVALERIMARLGEATQVSRVYAFENREDGDELRIRARGEWTADGVPSERESADLDGAGYSESGFDRWRTILQSGGVVVGHTHEFPASERPLLEMQDIRSLLVVPIFAGEVWWGWIGFDACESERFWRPAELDALRAVADAVGLALQRRGTEADLRDSRQRYKMILDSGSDAIFMFGIDGAGRGTSFKEVNDVACQRFGYTREELLAMTPHDLERRGERSPVELRSLRPGDSFLLERTYRTKSGDWLPVEVSSRAVRINGELLVVSIARDVSERKEAEAALRESEAQLRQAQKMEAIGRLSGGVAHDFNNLITGIKGTAELALEGLSPDHPLTSDLDDILHSADRAATLTGQLLSFSRHRVIEPVDVDLPVVLEDMHRLLSRLLGEDVEFSMQLSENLAGVRLGNGQVEQVLLNLAVNARDAMPDGGSLVIEATNRTVPAESSDEPSGACVAITVRDTGTGMAPEVREQIFEPFFTTKAPGRGTGIGLSTVYGIIRQAGGSIQVESEPGVGSTFQILLPAVPRPVVARSEGPTRRGAGMGERVLLVEDNATVAQLVRRVLERDGYRVESAASGEEALAADSGTIDLVVTDIVLPGISGRELVAALRDADPRLPVIFMSGYSAEEVNGAGDSTLEHFVQKPFSPRELADRVRKVLDAGSRRNGSKKGEGQPAR